MPPSCHPRRPRRTASTPSRPTDRDRDDGLRLAGVWITAVARCAPPGNRPTPAELATCRTWFAHDVDGLPGVRAVLALGRIAHDGVLYLWRARGLRSPRSAHPFAHGAVHRFEGLPPLVDAYHVSRQNTQTGRLTAAMFDAALASAAALAGLGSDRADAGPDAARASVRR